jgi:hypothetical protein
MKFVKILLILLIELSLSRCVKNNENRIIGVKIYDYNGNYEELTRKWDEMGINTVFAGESLAADENFRHALEDRNIVVYVIFPVFQDPEALKLDSGLYAITEKGTKAKNDWVEFVCPSRMEFRRKKINEISELIKSLDPYGISLDFIRQFVYWEMIYPDRDPSTIERACYCDSCLSAFSASYGIVIPDSCKNTYDKSRWINKNCLSSWNDFRCWQITSMVKALAARAREIKPDIKINLHAVPWREEDFNNAGISVAGQDLKAIEPYVDYISPMCYSQMLKRDAEWISSVSSDMNRRAPGKILPSIQVYPYYLERPFSTGDFTLCIRNSLKQPSLGVVFFSWPLFEKDSSRMDAVSVVLRRN